MGREAECEARVGREQGRVKALLESRELILRGAIKRRWPLPDLREVQVADGALRLQVGDEAVQLTLGATEAAAWAKKIATPPPGLAAKLGVGAGVPAFVIGPLPDAELAAALAGCTTTRPAAAVLALALVQDAAALEAALLAHAGLPQARHLWLVYPKGRDSTLPDSAVRERLRAAAYVDSKSCAVSDRFTATRYARR